MDLPKSKSESRDIYQMLCHSRYMHIKYTNLKYYSITEYLDNALAVLLNSDFNTITGSTGEGTDITSQDYSKNVHSKTPRYVSDKDYMTVLGDVRVIDEGDTLPQRFDDYMYIQAERGKHTTDGFRKLRIIHCPKYYSSKQHKAESLVNAIKISVEHEYISSSKWLAATLQTGTIFSSPNPTVKTCIGRHGPSQIIEHDGSPDDFVSCFYVKIWPKEAESWFTRQAHWPDITLKRKIRKIGYILVPIGNRKSKERDLEWRCSFSRAEKIIFHSLTKLQRCTFVMLKVLLKENLPSDINTDGEKQLLSTYHIKTLFLWSREDSQMKWEPEDMLGNIGKMFEKLLRCINGQYFPHYFIPSVNLIGGSQLHGRKNLFLSCISAIRNDLSNKIKRSQFLTMGQEIFDFTVMLDNNLCRMFIYHDIMQWLTGILQMLIQKELIVIMIYRKLNFSHSVLIEDLISNKRDVDPQMRHLYRALYTDPVHDKLLTEVAPGLIDRYLSCLHLAKYCMAARDGRLLPDVLHEAESLLKNTLHLDPCSGYAKLSCLYIACGDFVQAMKNVHATERNFWFVHKEIMPSALRKLYLNGVSIDRISTEEMYDIFDKVFQKWVEGQVTCNIVVTWLECITVPDLIQFELIHESTQHFFNIPFKHGAEQGKMVSFVCFLEWPPLSFIKLLKFVCAFYSGQSSTIYMENLVADLITSSLSLIVYLNVNDTYTVFNMAAWCYVKIKKYKLAT